MKWNTNFSSSVTLATLQAVKSHTWRILDIRDLEYFHPYGHFNWTVLQIPYWCWRNPVKTTGKLYATRISKHSKNVRAPWCQLCKLNAEGEKKKSLTWDLLKCSQGLPPGVGARWTCFSDAFYACLKFWSFLQWACATFKFELWGTQAPKGSQETSEAHGKKWFYSTLPWIIHSFVWTKPKKKSSKLKIQHVLGNIKNKVKENKNSASTTDVNSVFFSLPRIWG